MMEQKWLTRKKVERYSKFGVWKLENVQKETLRKGGRGYSFQ